MRIQHPFKSKKFQQFFAKFKLKKFPKFQQIFTKFSFLKSTKFRQIFAKFSFLKKPKFYFILGIVFNLALLGFFKYVDFFLENFNLLAQILSLNFLKIPLPHILLPLALSFVTFQQIAFLFDCYKRSKGEFSEQIELNFIDYALFISFFPQLIAGPIVHHSQMMPQFAAMSDLKAQNTINFEFLAKGIFIFCIGLFKKVFIADSFAKWADKGFEVAQNIAQISAQITQNSSQISQNLEQNLSQNLAQISTLNPFEAWASSLSYTFQLYFDFSGYCDMALGLGLMFGIVLALNFASPYKAQNIADFWRRWHITLGRFLRECLYIPLGGNKVRKVLNLRNLFIVAFLSGVWHGAGWGFVIWGVMHGFAMCIHRVYSWFLKSLKAEKFAQNEFLKSLKAEKFAQNDTANKAWQSQNSQSEIHANFKVKNAFLNFTQSKIKNAFLNFTQSKIYAVLAWFLTFNFINLAWIFFRADSVKSAFVMIKSMFDFSAPLPEKWHRMPELLAQINGRNDTLFYILIAIFVCVFAKNSWELTQEFSHKSPKMLYLYAVFASALSAISLYMMSFAMRQSEFLYFNF